MLLLAAAVVVGAWGARRVLVARRTVVADIPAEAIQRRDIAQTVEATGTVQPIQVVEIKSKASGQILRMPVELGSVVHTGDLLAQIDTVTVQNQYNQSLAALKAAEADVEISDAQKKRADTLYSREVLTADQHEAAVLAYANAVSTLARAQSDLEIARQALSDATVRAPSPGTIIEQDVTKGQVIASATASASGGTTLLKMADLSKVQMQALVGETDIGNVKPGQSAAVTVDAFPNRPFRGEVVKIQPQAVVQQSVTMFPVLISIANENGLLLPGMNGEVTVSIDERTGVVAVPLDAVRSVRELPTVAAALGMDADSLRAQVQRMARARFAGRAGGGGDSMRAAGYSGGRDSLRMARFGGGGRDSARARGGRGGGGGNGGGGSGRGGGYGRGGGQGGGFGRGGGAGGGFGGGGRGGFARGDSAAGRPGGMGGAGGMSGSRLAQAQLVFVATPQGYEPRLVRLGISDFDYAEVLDGLAEGDQVALLGVAEAQAKRQQDINRARQRVGTGLVPGAGGGGGGGRGPGGGGR
jgi:HlyD family secretion protein